MATATPQEKNFAEQVTLLTHTVTHTGMDWGRNYGDNRTEVSVLLEKSLSEGCKRS